ncbi:MAG: flavodoxin family protein [Asgard group archaeon]|nr:flavodoxin family protein [Asgard group archaeon]
MNKENKPIILSIVGSPRRNGNTEILVDEVLNGAKEANANIKKIILNELDITPCQACNQCSDTKKCIIEDDMKPVVKLMKKSDVWVFGTPIYWWGPTAQFKTFIDRWYGISKDIFSGKKIILVIPLGAGSAHYARHTVGMFEDIIPYRNAILFETILATGVNSKGAVKNKSEYLTKAFNAGKRVFENLI